MKFPKFLAFLEKDSNVWLTSAGTGLLAGGAVAAGLYLTSTVVLPTIATSAVTIAALIVTATGFGAIALVVVGLLAAAALFAFRRRGGDAFSSPATLPAVNSDLEQMQPYYQATLDALAKHLDIQISE